MIEDCFHNSCKSSNIKLLERLFDKFNAKEKLHDIEVETLMDKTYIKSSSSKEIIYSHDENLVDNNEIEASPLKEMTQKQIEKYKAALLEEQKQARLLFEINKIRSHLRYYRKKFVIPDDLKGRYL